MQQSASARIVENRRKENIGFLLVFYQIKIGESLSQSRKILHAIRYLRLHAYASLTVKPQYVFTIGEKD